jgi:hypothetical protein
MLFNAPSPKGTNHAGLFLTRAGHLVDRHGRDWGKSQIAKLAMDELPSSARDLPKPELSEAERREVEEDERVKKLCGALETAMEKLNLRPEYRGALLKIIEAHKKHEWGAKDAEPDHEGLREFLRSKGLDEESLREVFDIIESAEEEPEGKDRLPVPATKRGYGGYRSGRSKDDGESFERKFPEAQRINHAVPGTGQFDGANDRRGTRRSRQIAADAVSPDAGDRLAKRFGEHVGKIKIGEWAR